MTFTLADGTTITRRERLSASAIRRIRCRPTQLEEKFTALVAPRFGDDVARRALDVVRSLESIADIADASSATCSRSHRLRRVADRMTDDINPRADAVRRVSPGVRELCAQFDSEYWQEVDEEPRLSRRIRQRADATRAGSRR